MDVVVQDSDNVLYLFSNTGKLYWKKQLSGKIIGVFNKSISIRISVGNLLLGQLIE